MGRQLKRSVLAVSCALVLLLAIASCDETEPPPATPTLTLPSLTATPIEQGGDARPILYMGAERDGVMSIVVTRAVYPDGRDLGTVVRSIGATWSPNGQQIAFVTPTGMSMNVADLQGETRTLINSPGQWRPYYAWPAWSPDGTEIALIEVGWCDDGSRISDVVVIDVAQGKSTLRFGPYDFWHAEGTQDGPGRFSMPEALRWSPDGTKLLVSWDTVVVLDFATGRVEPISDTRAVAEWAPGSDAIYYYDVKRDPGSKGRSVSSLNIKTLGSDEATVLADGQRLEELGMIGTPGVIPGLLALSPSGSTLAATAGQSDDGTGTLRLYALADGELFAVERPAQSFQTEGRMVALDWSADGDSIAVLVVDETDSTTLQVLDLESGRWKAVGSPVVDVEGIADIPTILSWGR